MRLIKKVFLILIIGEIIVGCASRTISNNTLSSFKKGKTTYTQVVGVLGRPNDVESSVVGNSGLSKSGSTIIGYDTPDDHVQIYFDADDVYQNYIRNK